MNSVSILNKLKLKLLISDIRNLLVIFLYHFFLWWVCRFILHDTDILTVKKKLRRNKWQLTKYNKIERIIMDDFRDIEEGSWLPHSGNTGLYIILVAVIGIELCCYSTVGFSFSFSSNLLSYLRKCNLLYFTIVPNCFYLKFRGNRH